MTADEMAEAMAYAADGIMDWKIRAAVAEFVRLTGLSADADGNLEIGASIRACHLLLQIAEGAE